MIGASSGTDRHLRSCCHPLVGLHFSPLAAAANTLSAGRVCHSLAQPEQNRSAGLWPAACSPASWVSGGPRPVLRGEPLRLTEPRSEKSAQSANIFTDRNIARRSRNRQERGLQSASRLEPHR